MEIPVIGSIAPNLQSQRHAAFILAENADNAFLPADNPRILVDQPLKDAFGLLDIIVVANRKIQIQPAGFLGGIIHHVVGGNPGVGQNHVFIVRGDQCGKHQLDFVNGALQPLDFNIISYLKGLSDDNQNAAGHIGEAVLHRQGDGHRGGA